MAAGRYSKTKGENQFTSVFVFAKLEGPLIVLRYRGLEMAIVLITC